MQGHAHPTSRPPSLEFLGGPVVKDSCFHCREHRFDPRLGTSDPSEVWPKIFFGKRNTLMILPSRLSEGQLRGRVGGGVFAGGHGHSRSNHFNPPSGQIFTGLGTWVQDQRLGSQS